MITTTKPIIIPVESARVMIMPCEVADTLVVGEKVGSHVGSFVGFQVVGVLVSNVGLLLGVTVGIYVGLSVGVVGTTVGLKLIVNIVNMSEIKRISNWLVSALLVS